MAKDPAFLLYTQDFITGTMFMTDKQAGIYIRLLCAQHQHGGIIKKNLFNSKVGNDELLRSKFIETDDGFFNERLMKEMEKRSVKSSNLSDNAKVRWEKEKAKAMQLHNKSSKKGDAFLMPTENENTISIDNSNIIYNIYYDTELNLLNGDPKKEEYEKFIKFLFGDNELKTKLECWLKLEKQLSFEQYCKLREKAKKKNKKMAPMFLSGYNNPKYLKGKKTVYQTINTWLDRD